MATGGGQLAKDVLARFIAADGFSHARAVAFQLTLTALPGLISAVALTTILDQRPLRRVLEETLLRLVPGPATGVLTQAFHQGAGAGGGSGTSAFVVGLGVALISGTIAMALLERGANRIYGVQTDRPVLRKYLQAFLLTCSAGALTFLGFLLLTMGSAIGYAGRSVGGWSTSLLKVWSFARWPVGILIVVIAFSLLFKTAPHRRQPTASWLSLGSGLAALLWSVFTWLLFLYLRFSKEFGETYGPLAGIIGILLWTYLSSLALFLGLAFAAQLEGIRAGVSNPVEDRKGT
ncbi:MAG: YihY/virulence factor BrkB family protein [Actinomycetota bacterium]|nr:YihY/virulence factor BrkB family protein [Actinomycetota bacterium]